VRKRAFGKFLINAMIREAIIWIDQFFQEKFNPFPGQIISG